MLPVDVQPLEAGAFAEFGKVIGTDAARDTGVAPVAINQGTCERYSALALPELPKDAAGISLFDASPVPDTLRIHALERHPLGSQTFIPMHTYPFLVTVARDANGCPVTPQSFITNGKQGVHINRNVWHAALTVLHSAGGLFAVVDYVGADSNLEEHVLETPLNPML